MAEKVTLQVTGMHCTGCEQRVGKVLGRVAGVHAATADYRSGQVQVRFDSDLTDRIALAAQVERAGYTVTADTAGGDEAAR